MYFSLLMNDEYIFVSVFVMRFLLSVIINVQLASVTLSYLF